MERRKRGFASGALIFMSLAFAGGVGAQAEYPISPPTLAPTTLAPTTLAPTTIPPTTLAPTTLAPTTLAPTTVLVSAASVVASSVSAVVAAPPVPTVAPTTAAPPTPTTVPSSVASATTLAPTTTVNILGVQLTRPNAAPAFTGSNTMSKATIAAVLIGVGAMLLVLARRRRTSATS